MKKSSSLLFLAFILFGCTKSNGVNSSSQLPPPDFQIRVQLSDAAEQKLKTLSEAVKVIAYFSGDPNSGIWARLHTTEQGRIDIGTSEIELNIEKADPQTPGNAKLQLQPKSVREVSCHLVDRSHS